MSSKAVTEGVAADRAEVESVERQRVTPTGEVHPGFLTRKEIRDLFSRNAAPGRIPLALDLLEDLGLIERRKMETEGRYAEIVAMTDAERYDLNDLSPLVVAREAAKERGYTTETT